MTSRRRHILRHILCCIHRLHIFGPGPVLLGLWVNATSVAQAQDQVLYVVNGNDSTFEAFNTSGVGAPISYNRGNITPSYLAYDGQGSFYLTDVSNEAVQKLNLTTGQVTQFSVSGDVNGPGGITLDSSGNVYIANYFDNTITKFNTAGVGTQFNMSGALDLPGGVAFDTSGNLYVANYGDGSNSGHSGYIEKFNRSGVGTRFNIGALYDPQAIAFDAAGNLYVSNAGDNTITKFSSSGGFGSQFETRFLSGDLSAPSGLAFDSFGNLYVSNAGNNTIERFDISGVGSRFDSGGHLLGPLGLAFGPTVTSSDATPEPSSALLLLLPLGFSISLGVSPAGRAGRDTTEKASD